MNRRSREVDQDRRSGLLAGLRIRFKLIVLHTVFSLVLAGVLYLALRPAIAEVVRQAEQHEAGVVLRVILDQRSRQGEVANGFLSVPGVRVVQGDAAAVGLDALTAARVSSEQEPTRIDLGDLAGMVAYDASTREFTAVWVELEGARAAVTRLYVLMILALLLVYALVAAALEVFVLPQHVYAPIRSMLAADRALRDGRKEDELIPPGDIPADELGEIMLSRNQSVLALRKHETDLANALARLEAVATDLARKNHLLETARRNMAESDRLASLGLMSAGIAHELNTPLAVLKGMVEKVHRGATQGAAFKGGGGGGGGVGGAMGTGHGSGAPVSPEEAALMLRVVARLEKLSEGLLDFARVRPPQSKPVAVRPLIEEAWTLVRLDREAQGVEFVNDTPDDLEVIADGDRLVQVFVNLLRNAVDAMSSNAAGLPRRIEVAAEPGEGTAGSARAASPDAGSISLTIADSGPGIDSDLMSRLFQPFVSTRLDAKGTGLGLAVAEGIIKEHGGTIIARNRSDSRGTVFEILLPSAVREVDRASGGGNLVRSASDGGTGS